MYTVMLVAALSGATPAQMAQGCYGGPQVQHVSASVKAGEVVVQQNLLRYTYIHVEQIVRAVEVDGKIVERRDGARAVSKVHTIRTAHGVCLLLWFNFQK